MIILKYLLAILNMCSLITGLDILLENIYPQNYFKKCVTIMELVHIYLYYVLLFLSNFWNFQTSYNIFYFVCYR